MLIINNVFFPVLSNDFFLRRLPIGFTINHRFEWQDNFLFFRGEKNPSKHRTNVASSRHKNANSLSKPGERLTAPAWPRTFLKAEESYPAQ
jgi:hypothetical protein